MKNILLSICLIGLTACPTQPSSEGQSCKIDEDCQTELVCEDQICKKEEEIDFTTTLSSTTEESPTTTEISTSGEPTTSLGSSSTTIEYDLGNPGVPSICNPDGIVDGIEECDDLVDINCHNCLKDRYVFVTSFPVTTPFPSNACNFAGQLTFGLDLNFKPLVHYINSDLNDYVIFGSNSRYILSTGDLFAENFEDIINDNNILNAPSFDEYGNFQSVYVWTGNDEWNCKDWYIWSGSSILGKSDELDFWWNTNPDRNILGNCNESYHLYCIEDY
jgi:hypothetical protein